MHMLPSCNLKRCCALLFFVTLVVVTEFYCPYTKVEESFNMQAMHDFLFEPDTEAFDHHRFPGVVPRTFLGAWIVSVVALPLLATVGGQRGTLWLQEHAMLASHVCRLLLAAIVVASFVVVATALDHRRPTSTKKAAGAQPPKKTGNALDVAAAAAGTSVTEQPSQAPRSRTSSRGAVFLLLCAAQFHLVSYASRPLPNTFGLVCGNIALWGTLRHRSGAGVAALTAGAALFRCDILALLAPYGLYALCIDSRSASNSEASCDDGVNKEGSLSTPPAPQNSRLGVLAGICIGLTTAALSVGCTALGMDSFLWSRWLWPEGSVLLFNTAENRSVEWGVMPWHWYWSRALPRALLLAYPVVLLLGTAAFFHAMLCYSPLRRLLPAQLQVALRTRYARAKLLRVSVEMSPLLVPALTFIALYSALPHKELRFLLVAVPWLLAPVAAWIAGEDNIANSVSVSTCQGKPSKRPSSFCSLAWPTMLTLSYLAMLGSVALSVVVTEGNYPGSDALNRLHEQIIADVRGASHDSAVIGSAGMSATPSSSSSSLTCVQKRVEAAAVAVAAAGKDTKTSTADVLVTVFIDAYAAMTGINRFQKLYTPLRVTGARYGSHTVHSRGASSNDDDATAAATERSDLWFRWQALLKLPWEALMWRARVCLGQLPIHLRQSVETTHAACRYALTPSSSESTQVRGHSRRQTGSGAAFVQLRYTKDPTLFMTAAEHRSHVRAAAGSGPVAQHQGTHKDAAQGERGKEEDDNVGVQTEVYRAEGLDYAIVRASQRELHLGTHDDFELLFPVRVRSSVVMRRCMATVVKLMARVAPGVARRLEGSADGEEKEGEGGAFLLVLRRKRCR